MNLKRFLIQNIFFPLTRAVVTTALMPGLMIEDWAAGMKLARQGDVVSTQRYSEAVDGIFCVFHLYQPYGLPANVVRAIATLSELGVRIVAVANTPLPERELARIRPYLHSFIQRRNFGRDFGGYRRGVLHVLDSYKPDRLILLNDSLFYAKRGLKAFFEELCGDDAFIGANENHELTYHVGSFALSFGPQVLADPRFRRYWETYRSTEIRPRVIRKGEAALSRLIVRTMKVRPRIIYSLQRLDAALSKADWRQLTQSAAQMPGDYAGQNPVRQLLRDAKKPARESMPVSKATFLDSVSLTLPLSSEELLAELNLQHRRDLQRDLLGYVFRGSQIHWGALLLTQYLNMPIIKLDLVLRSIYKIGELNCFAPYLDEDEFAEFYAMVTARGEPMTHGTLKQKLMMMTGLL